MSDFSELEVSELENFCKSAEKLFPLLKPLGDEVLSSLPLEDPSLLTLSVASESLVIAEETCKNETVNT